VPSLSTVMVATLRRALFATRSRCDVVTRRVSRALSCGSLCNCAPAAKGKDANDSNSEVSASTAAASTSMSDGDDAIANCPCAFLPSRIAEDVTIRYFCARGGGARGAWGVSTAIWKAARTRGRRIGRDGGHGGGCHRTQAAE
jgi:hypothetical protein